MIDDVDIEANFPYPNSAGRSMTQEERMIVRIRMMLAQRALEEALAEAGPGIRQSEF